MYNQNNNNSGARKQRNLYTNNQSQPVMQIQQLQHQRHAPQQLLQQRLQNQSQMRYQTNNNNHQYNLNGQHHYRHQQQMHPVQQQYQPHRHQQQTVHNNQRIQPKFNHAANKTSMIDESSKFTHKQHRQYQQTQHLNTTTQKQQRTRTWHRNNTEFNSFREMSSPIVSMTPNLDTEFSVITYNILADSYVNKKMFNTSPVFALQWTFRRHHILAQLLAHQTDVVCLQEIECQAYLDFFKPQLAEYNYQSIFAPKSRFKTMSDERRKRVDGCAIFYKADKFKLVDHHVIEFNQLAMANAQGSEAMLNRVMPKDNIALAAVLDYIGDRNSNTKSDNGTIIKNRDANNIVESEIYITGQKIQKHGMDAEDSNSSCSLSSLNSIGSHNDSSNLYWSTTNDITQKQSPLSSSSYGSEGISSDEEHFVKNVLKNFPSLVKQQAARNNILAASQPAVPSNDKVPKYQDDRPKRLLVCTAHLHWDPEYCDVKLIQTIMMMNELKAIAKRYSLSKVKARDDYKARKRAFVANNTIHEVGGDNMNSLMDMELDDDDYEDEEDDDDTIDEGMGYSNSNFRKLLPLVLCGDFNSLPDSGPLQFLTEKVLASSHVDLKNYKYNKCSNHLFSRAKDYRRKSTPAISIYGSSNLNLPSNNVQFNYCHPFTDLASAYELDDTAVTNYAKNFKGMIDYIFHSQDTIENLGTLKLSQQWLHKNGYPPHQYLPSDHTLLLAKFKF